ncbi:MAG: hypothetical protein LBI67_09175 [Treponema sp.]|nr:hypothetical protein [Treponema sp.]
MKAFFRYGAFALAALAAAPFSAAQEAAVTAGGEPLPDSGGTLSGLSVTSLLGAAAGDSLHWRPDWPVSVPPDLFYTLDESGAAGVTVRFEAPKKSFAEEDTVPRAGAGGTSPADSPVGTGGAVSFRRRDGVLLRFPVFHDSRFFQAGAEYDASRSLERVTGDDFEMLILESDAEGRPGVVRIKTGDDYFFVAMDYSGGRASETWYTEDGVPKAVMYTSDAGDSVEIRYGESAAAETRTFFFNSFGSISQIRSAAGTWSALYERRGLPRYLDRNLGNGIEQYRFQWDEAGRLTRLSAGIRTEDGTDSGSADSRFEYVLDDRGNWIVRREIRMVNLSGRLFPAPGSVIKRQIHYGDAP